MSLDFTLELVTEHAPAVIAGMLTELNLNFEPSGDSVHLSAPGVFVGVATTSEAGRRITREHFGLDPAVFVLFSLQKRNYQAGLEATIKSALGLIEKTDQDAILLFNHETPLLKSIGGVLTLNRDGDFWESESGALLSLVDKPYGLDHMPSL